jgi:hypothetical protein
VATFGLGFDWNPTCTVCFDGVRVVFDFDASDYFYFTANVLGSFGPVSSGRDVVNGFSFAQFTPVAVSEHGTLALLGLGLAGLGLGRRKAD